MRAIFMGMRCLLMRMRTAGAHMLDLYTQRAPSKGENFLFGLPCCRENSILFLPRGCPEPRKGAREYMKTREKMRDSPPIWAYRDWNGSHIF